VTDPHRYHLLLTVDGQPAQHGWWGDASVARRKFMVWVGSRGRPGTRITLVDEDAGETLTEWPEKT
jgi:hypothetical protein